MNPTAAVLLLLLGLFRLSLSIPDDERATYIVHLSKSQMPPSFKLHHDWYHSSLRSVSPNAEFIYTYDFALHGYATRLTPSEATTLAGRSGVLSVVPERRYELHTTRSPEFLGLDRSNDVFSDSGLASDIIVGILDTGVWPESKSFDDAGMGPIPAGWKGECEAGTNFTASHCNQKLIGARFFARGYEAVSGPVDETKEFRSPRDDDGHGTHTASTAAGAAVDGASLFGYAAGKARGMARRARVAVYKVCWKAGCFNSDMLAAIDKAIADGVHVLSLSIGGGSATEYLGDDVAIGAFAAMEKGIVVSCSAGNDGPGPKTLSNQAPWIMTVGAGTLDRNFPAFVSLGNGKNYSGVSLFKGDSLPPPMIPIIYAGKATNATNVTNGNLCMPGTLIHEKVAGKIVVCDRGVSPRAQKGVVVKAAGGAGMILANTAENGEELMADAHLVPATAVGQKAGDNIKTYLFSDPRPKATISFEGTMLGVEPSPVVAAFSSRGPNALTPGVFKPDLIAPGVNILAAWTEMAGPTSLPVDNRRVGFNIISGTSMSCPHVSGLAALIKAAHPDWSPSAIKSALMTSAYITYKNGKKIVDLATGKPSTPFVHGAGHVNPVSALDPGLVYDLTVDDYLGFLCGLGYSPSQIKMVTRSNFTCDAKKNYNLADFNYPAFAVPFQTGLMGPGAMKGKPSKVIKNTRTLTNVGPPGTYKVKAISESPVVKISVKPETLVFTKAGEKKSYTVTFTTSSMSLQNESFGRIEWSDGKHVVGSPVGFSWL